MTPAFSSDGGRAWPDRHDLEAGDGHCLTDNSRDGLNRELSYPTIRQTPDGTLHIACTHHRKAISTCGSPSPQANDDLRLRARPRHRARRRCPGRGDPAHSLIYRGTMYRMVIYRPRMVRRSTVMSEPTYFVLAALLDGPLHGYGIIKRAGEQSGGRVRLAVGTLYGALDRLAGDGLVAVDREETVRGRPRRYYRLTEDGRLALAREAARMEQAARVVTARMAPGAAGAAGA